MPWFCIRGSSKLIPAGFPRHALCRSTRSLELSLGLPIRTEAESG